MGILAEPLPNSSASNYLKCAAKFAIRSDHTRHKMAAIIVKGGNILSWGVNRNRTHPRSKNYYQSIHAELDAIIGVPRESLSGSKIYIIRVTRIGHLASSKPCVKCVALLSALGLKSMTYVSEDGKITKEHL